MALVEDGVNQTNHLAANSPMDPQMAEEYYGGKMFTYSGEDIMKPWVVEITIKDPLTKWWNRGDDEDHYQMYVDLGCVVYGQSENNLYHDTLYVAPYTEKKADRCV